MDFRRIAHFVAVAETGSLTLAARRLNIVQPALSHSIARLEEELSVQLFNRSRKGMDLTEAGSLFLKSAYGILNQYSRAKENISAIGDSPQGQVSIAMTASALHTLSVPLCRAVGDRYPRITLNLEEGLPANIQQGFDAGFYDVVVSFLNRPDDRVCVEPLIDEELYLAGPAGAFADIEEIELHDLVHYPLIIPQAQHGVSGSIFEAARAIGAKITLAPISAALHPTLQLIEAAQGFSILPWSAIHDRVASGLLSACAVKSPQIRHEVCMAYPLHRPLTQAAMRVMELLKETMRAAHRAGATRGRLLIDPPALD